MQEECSRHGLMVRVPRGGVLLLVLVAEQSTGGVREEKGGGMNWNDTAGRGSAGAG